MVERVAGLGVHIDDAGGVKAELGRQAAVDQRYGIDQPGVQFLPEAVERLGQQHAVDAIGQVRVLAADVFLAEGILDDARRRNKIC